VVHVLEAGHITERRTDMKVIGFNGSPRKDGNTTTLMGYLLREIEKEGIETELVQLSAKAIRG
jgi:multimeric flavodoxin WrbA